MMSGPLTGMALIHLQRLRKYFSIRCIIAIKMLASYINVN